MFFRKYLSSLKSTHIFMVCFGLLMGGIFPFYSSLFFGSRAFAPLYVIGCLAAGFIVGTFCYYLIKEALKLYVERQLSSLSKIIGDATSTGPGKGDELQQLMECNQGLMDQVCLLVENVSRLAWEISSRHGDLTTDFGVMVTGNEKQATRGKATLKAVAEMNGFFSDLMDEIELIASKSEERTSISTEMSSATDEIAASSKEYSALVMEVSASIEQMAVSIRRTTADTEALASSIEETYNSITSIDASITNVRDNARRTSDCSEKVRTQAREGLEAMKAVIVTMGEIEKAAESSAQAVERLSRHSAQVGDFLEIIKGVVAQTTLLSLNASIIAAQAGEHGRSFAVVAGEIRELAMRTSSSAAEIEEIVGNIQKETAAAETAAKRGKKKVAEGVAVTYRGNEALTRIEESAAEASRMVQQIAGATDDEAAGSRMIMEAAERDLERVKQLSATILDEERAAALIVRSLDRMRVFTKKIETSTDEQARGNRLYMKTVLDDNEKVKKLRETCSQQIVMGEVLHKDVTEVDRLMQANVDEARRIMTEIDRINASIQSMHGEMASFR